MTNQTAVRDAILRAGTRSTLAKVAGTFGISKGDVVRYTDLCQTFFRIIESGDPTIAPKAVMIVRRSKEDLPADLKYKVA